MNTTALLSNLEASITSNFPEIAKHFNSGISAAELERLESTLNPYRLPQDCRKLYEWHDGAQEPLELIPGYAFLSLSQAIESYRLQLEIWRGTEGYNPLWFPIFEFQGDIYCVVLSRETSETSPVYLSFNQDTEIRMMFADFRTLLAVSTRCFEAGAYKLDDDFLIEDEDHVERIRAEFGNAAPTTHVDGTNSLSKFFTQSWPEHWKSAIGRTEDDYVLKGADNTVASYKSHPKPSRLHVEIIGLMGPSECSFLEIEDETGDMTVLCPDTAVGSRETQIGRHYEIEVEPVKQQPPFGDSCEAVIRRLILRK